MADNDNTTKPPADDAKTKNMLTRLEVAERLEEIQKRSLDRQNKIAELDGDLLSKKEIELKQAAELHEYQKRELAFLEKLSQEEREHVDKYEDKLRILKEQAIQTEGQAEDWEKIRGLVETTTSDATQLAQEFFGISSEARKLANHLKKGDDVAKGFADKTLKLVIDRANQIAQVTLKMQETFRKMGKSVKETYGFSKPIELAKKFYDESRKTAREVNVLTSSELENFNQRTSVIAKSTRYTRDEIQKNYKGLFKASVAFRQSSKLDQDSINAVSLTLQRRLGVSAQTTIKTVEELTLTFGKSRQEAQKLTANLAMMAKTLNMDVNKVLGDFAAQSSNLAKLGIPNLTEEFMRMQEVQEKSGVSMDKLMSSMEKWSTIQGAATAASKLNAVFGTTIDFMEIMDTHNLEGPLKAFVKLRTAMEESGESIETMNLPRLRALSESFGMSALELKKFAKISTSTLDDIANKPASAYKSLSEVMNDVKQGEEALETRGESLGKTQDNQAKTMQFMVDTMQDFKKSIDKLADAFGPLTMVLSSAGGALISFTGQIAALKVAQVMMGIPGGGKGGEGGSGFFGKMTGGFGSIAKFAMRSAGAIAMVGSAYAANKMAKEKGGVTAGSFATGVGGGILSGLMISGGNPIGAVLGGIAGGVASLGLFDIGRDPSSTPGKAIAINAGKGVDETVTEFGANASVQKRKEDQPVVIVTHITNKLADGTIVSKETHDSRDQLASNYGDREFNFMKDINLAT
jgi:hypothetical protein